MMAVAWCALLLCTIAHMAIEGHSTTSSELWQPAEVAPQGHVTLPGLWRVHMCETSHTCHRNEGCLELRAMCRPGENCQRQRRPPHRICVPVGTNVNVSLQNSCQGDCPVGCRRECRQPVVSTCTGEDCLLNTYINGCVVGKGSQATCDELPSRPPPPTHEVPQERRCRVCEDLRFRRNCDAARFDFIIRAKIIKRTQEAYTVRIKQKPFYNARNLTLLSSTPVLLHRKQLNRAHVSRVNCNCPDLEPESVYVIAGTVKNGRLLLTRPFSAAIISTNYRQSRILINLLVQQARDCASSATAGAYEEYDEEGNLVDNSNFTLVPDEPGHHHAHSTSNTPDSTATTTARPDTHHSTVSTVGRPERSVDNAPLNVYHARIGAMAESELWHRAIKLTSSP